MLRGLVNVWQITTFNAATRVLHTTSGLVITFGASSSANGDHQWLPTQLKDRNGNYVTINYKTLDSNKVVIDYVTDTAGRRIDFVYQNNRLVSIGQTRAGGAWYDFAKIEYQYVNIQTAFAAPLTTDPPTINGTLVYLPWRITYPTGLSHQFTYNSYGQMTQISKGVPYVNGQSNARLIAGTQFTLSGNADYHGITSRLEWAEYWQGGALQTYQYQFNTPNGHEVTDPLGRRFRVLTNGLVQTPSVLAAGSGSATKSETLTFDQDYQ